MKLERKLYPRIQVINKGRDLNEIKSGGLDLMRSVGCCREGHGVRGAPDAGITEYLWRIYMNQ